MNEFISSLGPSIARFLTHRRALGFAYRREEEWLRMFDSQLAETSDGQQVLTEAAVREFLAGASPGSRPHRLVVIRQLARFLAAEVPGTFVPPPRFLGIRRRRPVIRVLSREESTRFLDACLKVPATTRSPLKGVVHGGALRILLLAGLRRDEVLKLLDADVDLEEGVLIIRQSKFGKSRFVPLVPDEVQRLRSLRNTLLQQFPQRGPTSAFFPGPDGCRPITRSKLYHTFRQVLGIAGIAHQGRGQGPRQHDLRHSFAVLRLLTWYEQGADLEVKLPLLATYMGHVGMSSTQVYLHMTRDLIGEVIQRQQRYFANLITVEVNP